MFHPCCCLLSSQWLGRYCLMTGIFGSVGMWLSHGSYTQLQCFLSIHIGTWFKHILFMTEHDKGLDRAKKLCLCCSLKHTHAHIIQLN